MDFSKIKKIYMIGVKGVGMTMLAEYLAAQTGLRQGCGGQGGIKVEGSDTEEKFMTDEVLKKAGVKVIEHFDKKNIPAGADLIVYSTAYSAENNPEVVAALAGRIKVLTYAEALAEVFNQKYGIAVIGSHGKTTTTAWLGYVLEKAGLAPSVMVGSRVPQFNGLSIAGKSNYLVVELDEYQNKIKYFNPRAVLLSNIDYDHPDFFKTKADYENVFIEFIKKIPLSGFLVANWDDPIIRKVARVNCRGKIITYAINEAADFVAYNIRQEKNPPCPLPARASQRQAGPLIKGASGWQYFKVKMADEDENAEFLGDFSIQLAGRHNIANALAVIAACVELGVGLFEIRKYLEEFAGTARRMEVLGEFRGATIIDDYAHHPTEIKATLAGARQLYPKNKLIVVFHPHTFTRTKALLNDFAKSFGEADEVIVLDIYGSAREEQGGVHSADLVREIKNQKPARNASLIEAGGSKIKNIKYIPTLASCEKYLRKNAGRGDVILLMGAGDVFRIGEKLVKN